MWRTEGNRFPGCDLVDAGQARGGLVKRGIEVKETVPIAGVDCFRIPDPGSGNIELIPRVRRRDDWSEEEPGLPDNQDRSMLIDEWQEERCRQESPT